MATSRRVGNACRSATRGGVANGGMKVSVVIPVYKAERFVEEAARSALAQPETGEVILVEDGSPDNALAVCRDLAKTDERIRLLQHPDGRNHGAGASRNLGIQSARHPLVAFLDADDVYVPGCFGDAVNLLATQPDIDGVYGTVALFANDEEALDRHRKSSWPSTLGMRRRVAPEELLDVLTAGGAGSFCTDGIVVRRTLFGKSGLFDSRFSISQDTHLWIRMAAVGRLAPIPRGQMMARARIHADNRVTGRDGAFRLAGSRLVWAALLRWCNTHNTSYSSRRSLARRYVSATQGLVSHKGIFPATFLSVTSCLFLLTHASRPWKVEGFSTLAFNASGVGLLWTRTRAWLSARGAT